MFSRNKLPLQRNGLPKRTYSRKPMKFSLDDFIKYYDNLTDEQWNVLIGLCAKQGYDIRCIYGYKKEFGDEFTVLFADEILNPLLVLERCAGYMSVRDSFVEYQGDVQAQQVIEKRYANYGLPIPDYWRKRLWIS